MMDRQPERMHDENDVFEEITWHKIGAMSFWLNERHAKRWLLFQQGLDYNTGKPLTKSHDR